jgi:hypothetical protein
VLSVIAIEGGRHVVAESDLGSTLGSDVTERVCPTPHSSRSEILVIALRGSDLSRALLVLGVACVFAVGCRDDTNLFTVAGQLKITTFQLCTQRGEVLWRVGAEKEIPISTIRYGSVPKGFKQEFPNSGLQPRPLRTGEGVAAVIVCRDYIYRHEGFATSGVGFRGGFGETSPFNSETLTLAMHCARITQDIPTPTAR